MHRQQVQQQREQHFNNNYKLNNNKQQLGLPTTKQDFETQEQFEARQKLADAQQRAA